MVDLGVNAVSAIPLTGNPVPLDASLTPDGTLIYVGANDGSLHVVSTVSGGDLEQITFSTGNNSNKSQPLQQRPANLQPRPRGSAAIVRLSGTGLACHPERREGPLHFSRRGARLGKKKIFEESATATAAPFPDPAPRYRARH